MAVDAPEQPQRPAATAGALLRAAREKQGLHIGALAASIKVTPRKLEALEADRYGELPDATFARALAQTVCRSLRIDPAPVLALLPRVDPSALDHAGGTLNTPFRERPGRESAGRLAAAAVRPLMWAAAALLVAAAVVYLLPPSLWRPAPDNAQPVSAAPPAPPAISAAPSAASSSAAAADADLTGMAASPAGNTVGSFPARAGPTADGRSIAALPPPPPLPSPSPPASALPAQSAAAAATVQTAASAAAALVQIQVEGASWVELRDGRGRVLVSRVLQASESAGFDGALPIKLTIGNARGTRLRFRGQPVDLTASTRDNVARLELQ